jgi:folate-binding protein YgfZ
MLATSAIAIGALDPSHVDAGVAAHYGDPVKEQRMLATDVGLVDRGNRGVVAVPGPDRLTWLHDITTQHLSTLAPMTGTELLVLSPHGHAEHHAVVLEDGQTTWLDTEPGAAPGLLAYLTSMQFLTRVSPADVTAEWAVLSLAGPKASSVDLGIAALEPPAIAAVPGPKFASGSVPAGPTVRYDAAALPGGGFARRMAYGIDLLLPRQSVPEFVARLGVPLAGLWAFEALRVADRRPRLGLDTDHRTLPAEVGWLAETVHLEKGCYRGQETVAKIHNLGRPPRRLVLLHLDGLSTQELPEPGTPVTTAEGRTVGRTGTAVRHFELGQIALALIKHSVPDDADLRVGPSAASIDIA